MIHRQPKNTTAKKFTFFILVLSPTFIPIVIRARNKKKRAGSRQLNKKLPSK
jgi:hypothetical protein